MASEQRHVKCEDTLLSPIAGSDSWCHAQLPILARGPDDFAEIVADLDALFDECLHETIYWRPESDPLLVCGSFDADDARAEGSERALESLLTVSMRPTIFCNASVAMPRTGTEAGAIAIANWWMCELMDAWW